MTERTGFTVALREGGHISLDDFVEETAGFVNRSLQSRDKAIRDLTDAIIALDDRLLALEKREAAMHYRGTWQPIENYQPGSVVYHRESLFVAHHAAEPGQTPGDRSVWQVLVPGISDRRHHRFG